MAQSYYYSEMKGYGSFAGIEGQWHDEALTIRRACYFGSPSNTVTDACAGLENGGSASGKRGQ